MNEESAKFPPMSIEELTDILGLTIKSDNHNKAITFFSCLSAFTESNQFNISFNAPSSSGKSYIPMEIASLFPKEDVKIIGYASPTAFYHAEGEFKKDLGGYYVDLERKILVFLDQPHTQLLERLRPLLSHDQKEISILVTDKSQKHGLKTKNIVLRGYPSVIFCTAGLRLDEQEATRFLLLSPETSQEKLRFGVSEVIKKETDLKAYLDSLNSDPDRTALIARIMAIRDKRITEIRLHDKDKVKEEFLSKHKVLKPRHQRDIKRILSLIKTHCLLNLWQRESSGDLVIVTNTEDITAGFKLWDEIALSQELSLPPYVYQVYLEVVLTLFKEKNDGLTRNEIVQHYSQVYGRPLADWTLKRELIPAWEMNGLIRQEQDPADRRIHLIYPTTESNLFDEKNTLDSMVGDNITEWEKEDLYDKNI